MMPKFTSSLGLFWTRAQWLLSPFFRIELSISSSLLIVAAPHSQKIFDMRPTCRFYFWKEIVTNELQIFYELQRAGGGGWVCVYPPCSERYDMRTRELTCIGTCGQRKTPTVLNTDIDRRADADMHARTNTHAQTHAQVHIHTRTHTHAYTHKQPHSHAHTHTRRQTDREREIHAHTPFFSPSPSFSLSRSFTLSVSHTHTQAHTPTLSHTPTPNPTYTHSRSLLCHVLSITRRSHDKLRATPQPTARIRPATRLHNSNWRLPWHARSHFPDAARVCSSASWHVFRGDYSRGAFMSMYTRICTKNKYFERAAEHNVARRHACVLVRVLICFKTRKRNTCLHV